MYITWIILLLNIASIYGFGFYQFGHGGGYHKYLANLGRNDSQFFQSEEKWIEQRLDQFDSQETRTWKMRYFENLDYWQPNGPIYMDIGGEYTIDKFVYPGGYLQELAMETNGAIYFSEHRYYGKSIPLDMSVTDNFKYLSSQQALADVAYLLKTIKSSPDFQTSKVVVIGGSYAGSLAAWMRLLYPNLVDAAVASSGPVLAKKDFLEYLEKVGEDYKQFGPDGCYDKIVQIYQRYDELFSSAEGIEQLKQEENICDYDDMTKLENKQLFFRYKYGQFQMKAQYGTPADINNHCRQIMSSDDSNFNNLLFEDNATNFAIWNKENNCQDYDFNNMINDMKQEPDYLSWTYQTCTEFGYFQTTTSTNQPFTNNVPPDNYYKMCMGLFGQEFNEERVDKGVENTNQLYGGLTPKVTKVVFVNGGMDPWSRLGIVQDLSNDAPAIVIPEASHCKDLGPARNDDSQELINARANIKQLVKQWIGFGAYPA